MTTKRAKGGVKMTIKLKLSEGSKDRNLLRVSLPRAAADPATFGSKRSKQDSRLTRSVRLADLIRLHNAEVKEHGPKLEPDGVKDLKLEPVEQLEREESGVNLELRWRRHDPKPPWFLIQAQDISKWACDSFALFFPYLWFCPIGISKGRLLMRLMFHIPITHYADQDPSPSSGKIENVAMKSKGLF
ncbi:unnamed protein product [Microthlaspi erraticum]|uniref:Uncharacterized protein n=1 Tax=Microthlaspi erraticum TaxID=1685480 RepID=A0A6D2KLS1_9BRAS|nr:unnamed protein product [Microthlaspi erraticum]